VVWCDCGVGCPLTSANDESMLAVGRERTTSCLIRPKTNKQGTLRLKRDISISISKIIYLLSRSPLAAYFPSDTLGGMFHARPTQA